MSNNIPRRLRLKDKHPTAVKLDKLFAFADELGIGLSFYNHTVIVEDRDRDDKLPPLHLEDIEDDHNTSACFPPTTEYRLVYDNPAYLAEEAREFEERKQKEAEAKAAFKKAAEEKAKAEKERRAQQIEAQERKTLAELKAKYENATS